MKWRYHESSVRNERDWYAWHQRVVEAVAVLLRLRPHMDPEAYASTEHCLIKELLADASPETRAAIERRVKEGGGGEFR